MLAPLAESLGCLSDVSHLPFSQPLALCLHPTLPSPDPWLASPCSTCPLHRSRYSCQWDVACSPKCAKGSDLVNAAIAAIHSVDPSVVISVNGMGQDGYGGCAGQ